MTIKLKRVELSNIRTHEHIVFNPNDEGITAISGANGTGKSTIVDSIVWTMYGTKPKGVSKTSEIYRNKAKFGTDKCFAQIDLEVDGIKLRIERRMVTKAGAAECEVWEMEENEDGTPNLKQVAGPAVSHAESYIRKFMKMDEKGFLAAILVQQKQVDSLISASAKDRAQVIEDLTGVSSVTNALTESRSETNTLKKVVAAADVNENEFTKIKEELSKTETTVEKETDKFDKLGQEAQSSVSKVKELRSEVATESDKIDAADELKSKITTLEANIKAQEENLESVVTEKDAKKSQLSRLEASATLSEIEPKMQELRRKLREIENNEQGLKQNIKESKADLEKAKTLIDKSSIKDLDKANEGLVKMERKKESLEQEVNESKNNIISLESEANKLSKAINVLTDGEGTCPTCLQDVLDVTLAVKTLETQKTEIYAQRDEIKEKLEPIKINIKKTEINIEKFHQLIEAITLEEVLSESIPDEESELLELQGLAKGAEAEITAFDKIYQAAKRQGETKEEYNRLLARAKSLSSSIDGMQGELNKANQTIKQSGTITATALAKLRSNLEKSEESHSKVVAKLNDCRVELNVARERLSNLTEKSDDYSERLKVHQEILKTLEVSTATTKVIEEFRENRIMNSVPVLEVYASDLINRFTEGMFTGLKMDTKFNTKVILADGSERSVGLLSGGELSAAAIALRLSISMLLNGGASQNLMILDEVLVSQDDNRAEIILSTIKEVCQGQVILIAHNNATDAVADKIVELAAGR